MKKGKMSRIKRNKRTVPMFLSIIVVICIILLIVLPIPRKIDRTFKALEWAMDDPDISIEREIKIDGWYHPASDTFEGIIVLPGAVKSYVEEDMFIEMPSLIFREHMASLTYVSNPPLGLARNSGVVYAEDNFKELIIVLRGNADGEKRILSIGADKRDDALEQLLEHSAAEAIADFIEQ